MIRVAWLVPGGIGPEDDVTSNPILTSLFVRLSSEVDLTAFAFSRNTEPTVVRLRNGHLHMLPAAVHERSWKRFSIAREAVEQEHRRNPFDVVHGFWALPSGVIAAVLGKLLRMPSVVSFLGGEAAHVPSIPYGNMVRFRSRWLTRLAFRASTAVHVLTDFQRDALARRGMAGERVHVIPFGADAIFIRNKVRTPAPPYRFLHVSNLTEVKDQETLLRAFRRIADQVPAVLRIVGPDEMNGRLHRIAAELSLGPSVEFTGRVPHSLLTSHYSWAHVYLHASLYEGQSVSVVEAMSSGLPVCATRTGIVVDLPEGHAMTVVPGDAIALAHAAVQLITDDELYRRVGQHAYEWAADHSMEYSARELLRLYREVSGTTRSA